MQEKRGNFLRLVLPSLTIPSGPSPGHPLAQPFLRGAGEKRSFRANKPCLITPLRLWRRKGPPGAAGGTSALGVGWRSTTSSTWAARRCGWTWSNPTTLGLPPRVSKFTALQLLPTCPLCPLCVAAGLDTSTITSFTTLVALDYEETLTATATGRRLAATQLTLEL